MVRINPWKSCNPSNGHYLIDIGTIQQLDFGAPVKLCPETQRKHQLQSKDPSLTRDYKNAILRKDPSITKRL
jgi:hypothetical protein